MLDFIKKAVAGLKKAFPSISLKSSNQRGKFPWLARIQGAIACWLDQNAKKWPFISTFLQGGLTTFLGSACCGPFLGYAMGIALNSHWTLVLGAFGMAGLGMAFPYFLLSLWPKLTAWLPKTGPWSHVLKIIAGLGMIVTSIWLLTLL